MHLRPLTPDDDTAVSALLATAFDGPVEVALVTNLRTAGDFALELIAEEDDHIYGYIGFCRLVSPRDWWSLSPVAVSPSRQRRGVGSDLIRYGLDHARRSGAKAVTVLGDPGYYKRFGFTVKAAENLTHGFPPEYFMLYPIASRTAGAHHEIVYPEAFT